MSEYLLEYHASRKLESEAMEISRMTGANAFYSLLMAAARQAGSMELEKLEYAFRDAVQMLRSRYNAPAGILTSDTSDDVTVASLIIDLKERGLL